MMKKFAGFTCFTPPDLSLNNSLTLLSNKTSITNYLANGMTLAEINSHIPSNSFSFVTAINVDESKRPSGITTSFYYAIIPKNLNISGAGYGIVWSHMDDVHIATF